MGSEIRYVPAIYNEPSGKIIVAGRSIASRESALDCARRVAEETACARDSEWTPLVLEPCGRRARSRAEDSIEGVHSRWFVWFDGNAFSGEHDMEIDVADGRDHFYVICASGYKGMVTMKDYGALAAVSSFLQHNYPQRSIVKIEQVDLHQKG